MITRPWRWRLSRPRRFPRRVPLPLAMAAMRIGGAPLGRPSILPFAVSVANARSFSCRGQPCRDSDGRGLVPPLTTLGVRGRHSGHHGLLGGGGPPSAVRAAGGPLFTGLGALAPAARASSRSAWPPMPRRPGALVTLTVTLSVLRPENPRHATSSPDERDNQNPLGRISHEPHDIRGGPCGRSRLQGLPKRRSSRWPRARRATLAYNSGQAEGVAIVANGRTASPSAPSPWVGYMPLLQIGERSICGLCQRRPEGLPFAFTGTGNFDRVHPDVRLVGTMFNLTTGIYGAPCDLNLQSVDDMVGPPVGPRDRFRIQPPRPSSLLHRQGHPRATAGLGMSDFQQVPVSSFVDGINALGDGLVDVALGVSLNAGAGQEAAGAAAGSRRALLCLDERRPGGAGGLYRHSALGDHPRDAAERQHQRVADLGGPIFVAVPCDADGQRQRGRTGRS